MTSNLVALLRDLNTKIVRGETVYLGSALQDAANEIERLQSPDVRPTRQGGFTDLARRPTKPTRMLNISTATDKEASEHNSLMLGYWILEAQWQEKRADQLNAELTALLAAKAHQPADAPVADDRAFILQQLDGQWQKIAMCLLFKLSRDEPVVITTEDFKRLTEYLADGDKQLLTWGHADSIELRIMKKEDALCLARQVEGLGGSSIAS